MYNRPRLSWGVAHHQTSMRVQAFASLVLVVACSHRGARDAAVANTPADSSCDFVRMEAHQDPVALVEEFVARDANGEFTKANDWFNAAVDCPGHEPGPDHASMAKSHQVRILTRRPDSLVVEVIWQRVAYLGDAEYSMAPGLEYDTLTAIRTSFGWRIASPALNPHVPVPPAPRP